MTTTANTLSLIDRTLERLALDLRGLVVLTEAATGAFAVTATIAARAGATHVHALTRDSAYGRATEAERDTMTLAREASVADRITVHATRDQVPVAECDVVTNLGFVRPIDTRLIAQLKSTAILALMCEAWEFRAGDLDLACCHAHGITVMATNEHAPTLPVFAHCGPLGVQLLHDAGIAVQGTRVTVVGRDPFTPVLTDALQAAGAVVTADAIATSESLHVSLDGAAVVLLAEYAHDDVVLGDGGRLSAAQVKTVAPDAIIVQFAGALEAESLAANGVRVWPSPPVPPHRMSRTLAHLGAQPVIELHAAGLAGASVAARARLTGLPPQHAVRHACAQCDVAQALPDSLWASALHRPDSRGHDGSA